MKNMKKVGNSSCSDGFLLRMGLNDNKAGMQGLDKEKINKIIMEATKVGLSSLFLVLFLLSSVIRSCSSLPQMLSLPCVSGGQLPRRNACVGRNGRDYYKVLFDSSTGTWRNMTESSLGAPFLPKAIYKYHSIVQS